MHFVSYNTKYSNISEAVPHPDGLAVLGVFIKVYTASHFFILYILIYFIIYFEEGTETDSLKCPTVKFRK